ncbi:39S ribosomal protein L18, mitochondrial [Eurytemora carolleeae]|uniref:39S ribosomal protein L18, mitochondrial n=1 Tax=Eurytemora carolleeae TaxID=1294199 RepID=UPI000C765C48|nr:39S ribosomal protein L18, mitochondrial [Eurytemora carolleeae]|eukprot:XP_023348450.1 39S ribosomal protein L18, mitochondrial-like [Eurytemora affinis]
MSHIRAVLVPRFNRNILAALRYSTQSGVPGSSDAAYSNNDIIAPRVRNRNPMNLEMMCIGRKPEGFQLDSAPRKYWNGLTLQISNQHTTAEVRHWTGRVVAKASTREWPIRKQLYNLTDSAAVQTVAKIISQR